MDYDQPVTTIRPSSPSIAAQIQALDLLSARLQTLTDTTRWPARVPINSRATIDAQIVHTNDVKVNIGGGYWVAMTAVEAAEWVKRRKQELLLEHARRLEGVLHTGSHIRSEETPLGASSRMQMPPPIHLNPIFNYPIAGPSKPRIASPPARLPAGERTGRLQPVVQSKLQEDGAEEDMEEPRETSQEQDLTDVVGNFVKTRRQQAVSSKGANGVSVETNEEGLPIHEIREDLDGTTLGDLPPPAPGSIGPLTADGDAKEDYWSDAAKARRVALRRKVFNEGTDSESDVETAMAARPPKPDQLAPVPAAPVAKPFLSTGTGPSSLPETQPTSSTTPNPPKSILKAQPRKKSVTFDESVPLPPNSPQTIQAGKVGFPMPVHDVSDGRTFGEFEPAPVPLLNQPSLPKRKENDFAGFKPGFLSSNKPIPPVSRSLSGTATKGESSKLKTSLFAQRRAAQVEEGPGPVNEPPVPSSKGSSLPKMSSSQHMASMKNAVVEKVPFAATPGAASSSNLTHEVGTSQEPETGSHSLDEVEDEIEDDEEDEYDLDDALLAREVALDYHRRQIPLRHRSESDEEYEDPDDEGAGGVMLALPSVSNGKIVNPTPDELRKYVRVGRLENGNLVLAPGENAWSDEEDGDARTNREEVKRQLLGQGTAAPGLEGVSVQPARPKVKETPPRAAVDPGLPPTVRAVAEKKATQARADDSEEVPQKMSRFKAARMGLDA